MNLTKLGLSAAVLFSAISLASCGGSSSKAEDNVDYLPVKESSKGNWGFVGPDGKVVLSEEFKNEPSPVINGMFFVREGEGLSLYKMGEPAKVVGDCEGLYDVGYYADGLVPVTRKKQRIELVDGSGKTKFTLEAVKGKEIVKAAANYSDGMLLVATEDDKYGYVNTSGKVVIEPKYDMAASFSDGYAVAYVRGDENTDDKYYIIDKKGNETALRNGLRPQNAIFNDGYLTVYDSNDHVLFISTSGDEVKLPAKVQRAYEFDGKTFIYVSEDNQCGLMNVDGDVLIRAKYDNMERLRNGNLLCRADDKFLVLNQKGDEQVSTTDYRQLREIGKFGFVARDRNTYLLLDEKLKPVKNAEFEQIAMPYLNSFVTSDYFNTQAAVDDVVSLISAEGVDKYKLGEAPSAHLTDPESYSWQKSASIDDLKKSGYRYNVTVSLDFSGYISDYRYESFSSYTRVYYWNDVNLNGVTIRINTESTWGNEGSEAITAALKGKGFKEGLAKASEAGKYVALLQNGKIIAVVYSEKEARDGYVYLYKYDKAVYDNALSSFKEALDQDTRVDFSEAAAAAEVVDTIEAEPECIE